MRSILKSAVPLFARRILGKILSRERVRHSARFTVGQNGAPETLDCCIAYNRYGGYCVPLSSHHRPAAQAILNGPAWEENTIEFIKKNGRHGDVVHAGTYFGDFLPALSRCVGPTRTVWAFEPNPESHRCARITASLNDLRNIHLMHAGLGDIRTSLPIVTTDRAGRPLGGASTLVGEPGNDRPGTQIVSVVPLDEIVPQDRHVAVVQLDVEGFEEPALKGAIATIRRCRPILILENVPHGAWFADSILGFGYRETEKIHDNAVFTFDGGLV